MSTLEAGAPGATVTTGASAEPSLRKRGLAGSAWTIGSYGGSQAIRLGSNIVLAQFLSPAAFGIMTLVAVVLQGLRMFSDIGIGPALVQHARGEQPAFYKTAWALQAIRGVVLTVAGVGLAWPLAVMWGQPALVMPLMAMSFVNLISGFNSPALHLLARRMKYASLAAVELIPAVLIAIVTVGLATTLGSVWALVAGALSGTAAALVMSYLVLRDVEPGWAWDRGVVREQMSFGRWIFLSTLLTFAAGQIDRIVIGKLFTLDVIGLYGTAWALATVPTAVMSRLSGAVLFPVLSARAREDPKSLGRALRRARGLLLPACSFCSLGVLLGAPLLFGLYPSKWGAASWICQLMCVAVWFSMLEFSCDRVLLALGDSRSMAAAQGAKLVGTVAGCLGGYALGGLGGFVLGPALGAAAGHAVVQAGLWRRGIRIVASDLRYTLMTAVLGFAGWAFPHTALWGQTGLATWVGELVAAALVLGPLGLWLAIRLRREVRR